MLTPKFKYSILFLVCDANLGLLMQKNFLNTEFLIDVTYNPDIGIEKALSNKYDLLIMDSKKSPKQCFEILGRIRAINQSIPIIILGKKDNGENEIKTYRSGGNLFHYKPPNFPLLEAEIRHLLLDVSKNAILTMNDIQIDLTSRIIKRSGCEVKLTKSEFNFLVLLVKNSGKVITREKIISDILNYNKDVEYAAVDTMVSRIRKKLSQHGEEEVIQTVVKIGYRLNPVYTKSCKIRHYS